jgi:hypothetical protein
MALQESLVRPAWALANLPALIPLEFLAVARREKMSTLINACDGQTLKHVWDIGSHTGKNARRELRVFCADVDALLAGRPIPEFKHDDCLKQFLPATRGCKGTELQLHFTCGPDLIHDLEAAGALVAERERLAPVGPRASKLYSRDSIFKFLRSRFLGIVAHN